MKNSFLSYVIYFILLSLLLSGCAELLRNRTFIDEMDHDTDNLFVANHDFEVIPGDTGMAARTRKEILLRTPASYKQKMRKDHTISLEKELLEKEGRLTDFEYRDYANNDRYLSNISERIYYLDLPYRDRRDYIDTKRGLENSQNNLSGINFLRNPTFRDKELYLGMNKDLVRSNWCRPSHIDIAGNPANQNERWSFYSNGSVRTVFFENGVVQGWAIE